MSRRTPAIAGMLAIAIAPLTFAQSSIPQHNDKEDHREPTAIQEPFQQYKVTNLVSNVSGVAAVTDPNLANAWGLSRSSGGPWWVSDNATGLSTLYDGSGNITPLVVTIPPADPNASSTGSPTGTIFNGTTDFAVAPGAPAIFLFATEDGTISGWNPGAAPTTAIIVVNQKQKSVFKGLAMAQASIKGGPLANYLYVADFRKGTVAVFDGHFHHATEIEEQFNKIPAPRGYAPFNVQNLGGNIYVTLAKQDAAKHDEVDGAGFGYVVAFRPDGKLIQILQPGWWFNAPWGLAVAPSDFGAYSHDILVGNFGGHTVAAFDPITGNYKGTLRDATNKPIQIDGLWGLSAGNGGKAGAATAVYFGAGPNGEQDGLLGTITAIQNAAGNGN